MEVTILLFFVKLSQIIPLNGYMIYDETCNESMHQRFGIR